MCVAPGASPRDWMSDYITALHDPATAPAPPAPNGASLAWPAPLATSRRQNAESVGLQILRFDVSGEQAVAAARGVHIVEAGEAASLGGEVNGDRQGAVSPAGQVAFVSRRVLGEHE